jgi:elongation factor G
MAETDLANLRNLGIIAHIDAGKTTTTDHILYYAGEKHKLGYVDAGTTETDYDPEEQERGITIYSACVPFSWRDCTINLIDTPGHVDFTAEVERSLRVLDGCVVVFDAQKGVEAQSETVWRQADKYGVPRLVFVNKMDVVGANFENVLDAIRERLEGRPVALNIPIGSGSPKDSPTPFRGIIDLVQMKAIYFSERDEGKTFRTEEVPEELRADCQHWREMLFDVLTRNDDHDLVTSLVLEGKQVPAANVHRLVREQTLKRLIQPVLCGSGREHIGIQPLMDAVTLYLPSPLDRPAITGANPQKPDKEEKRKPNPKDPLCALVFKVVADKHGDRFFLRVYSGTLKTQSRVYNPRKDFKELVSKIYHVHADPKRNLEEVPEAPAGDIVALVGLRESVTGDTLCDPRHPILLEPIKFAEAVVSQSVEPQLSADKDKLTDTLNALKREDPTFDWRVNKETGQTLMSGMGTLHLEIKRHRMERDFGLKVKVGKPLVSFRETINKEVSGEGVFQKQIASTMVDARVGLQLRPSPQEHPPVEFSIDREAIDPATLAAMEQAIRGAFESGWLGYPVIKIQPVVRELKESKDAAPALNEMAVQAAAADAVNRALRDNVILLEPVMRLEVTVPEEYLGPITGDLNARRAEISQVAVRGKLCVIEALVPLRQMFDYSDKVRSLSQGRAGWTMEPRSYAPVPPDVLRGFLHPDEGY